ncbi:MAG: porin family protein, partial [Bacteroidota bacterium]
MKKLTYLFILLASGTCLGQQAGDIEIGIFAGISASNIVSAQDLIDSRLRPGVNGGVSADYYFSEAVSLEAEVYFNQNGRVIDKLSSDDGRAARTLSLHYITLAALPNYHFGQEYNWYVMAGPYISFLAGANQGRSSVKNEIKNNDVGLTGGLGYEFSLSEGSSTGFFVELVHQLGISNIIKDNVNE